MPSWGRGVQLLSVCGQSKCVSCVSLRFGDYRMVRGLAFGGGSPDVLKCNHIIYIKRMLNENHAPLCLNSDSGAE